LVKPRVFAKVLGRLITCCGSERLMFATGNNLAHPAPILKAFADYQIPAEVLAEFGFRQLTDEDRRRILGLNALRRLGVSEREALDAIRGDGFTHERAERIPGPWSALREARAEAVS
jgi:uncharacterized protein